MMVRLALATFEDVLAHELAFKDDGIPITDRYDLRAGWPNFDIVEQRRVINPGPMRSESQAQAAEDSAEWTW